jgi:acetate kinase
MKILIANFGSTTFKYRLFDLDAAQARVLTRGGYERVSNYKETVTDCLETLQDEGHLASLDELDAVGFKTVLGENLSGCVLADDKVLAALEGFTDLAPAHNPPYAEGIRMFAEICPTVQRVALFETAFYQWVQPAAAVYAVPASWRDIGIRRYGFHGASHKFVAERSAELLGREDVAARARDLYLDGPTEIARDDLRVVSCHLGGSSSVTGIRSGVAIGTSMGLSPQSGLPQNNRVGDLDSAAIPYAMRKLGLELEEVERQLTKESGLLGLSGGVSNDIRDLFAAANDGNQDAQLALDHYVHMIRHYIGAYTFDLNGLDALVFTAGIGENQAAIRSAVCAGADQLGIKLDESKNRAVDGETEISADDSPVKIFVIPANEELVVAREAYRLLNHLNN